MIESIELEDASCPLGCSKSDEIVFFGRDLLRNLPGEYPVVKCRNCGLLRTNPRPTSSTIGFYYPDDYGPYIGTRVQQTQPKTAGWLRMLLKPTFKHIFNFNTTTLPPIAPGRMLEIGCASGTFLHRMAKQGWDVQGIEFSEKVAQAAAQLGYRVHAGPLETAPQPDEPFDLIVGWMVLEHLHDPVTGLSKLRKWAKPGGWLVLSVPNTNSLEFKLFQNKWYDLHLPNHLYHFNSKTLAKLLLASGWKVEKVFYQRVMSSMVASLGYSLIDKGCKKLGFKLTKFPELGGPWASALLFPIALILSLFGKTGRMTIWARVSND
jgi:2-polyprenyl-3-methyl-5-hydroxy-6-metoxy-1,4-benzoquinol methylase